MPNYNVLESRRMSTKELLDEFSYSVDGGISGLGAIESIENPTTVSAEPLSEKVGNVERNSIENNLKYSGMEL